MSLYKNICTNFVGNFSSFSCDSNCNYFTDTDSKIAYVLHIVLIAAMNKQTQVLYLWIGPVTFVVAM